MKLGSLTWVARTLCANSNIIVSAEAVCENPVNVEIRFEVEGRAANTNVVGFRCSGVFGRFNMGRGTPAVSSCAAGLCTKDTKEALRSSLECLGGFR